MLKVDPFLSNEDESALVRFLQFKFGRGRPNGPEFFYDPKYALRLCLKEKKMRACIHIYSMMSMHEEAVALALQVDPELAMAEADKVEDDEDLRKKLWLMIAKHVIEQEKGVKRENIRRAIAFLKETDGLLKIEDILPFFPDFALIDDFKVPQLGPQQLRYITVRRDSSARFLLSSPAAQPALTTEESSTAPDSRLTLLDEDEEAVAALSFTDLDAWSRIPCAALAPPCTTTRLMYRKLIQRTHHRHTPAHTVHRVIGNDGPSADGFRRMTAGTKDSEVRVACSRGTCGRIPR
ncbi:hypothetical protein GW17_00014676 [Ensete ventricosum]|nr:hypothetical protein GW17_00014676 [Ensete ventricosum]